MPFWLKEFTKRVQQGKGDDWYKYSLSLSGVSALEEISVNY